MDELVSKANELPDEAASGLSAGLSGDNRQEFEAWASDGGKWKQAVERSGEHYRLSVTNTYWEAWKARGESREIKALRKALRAAVEDCSMSMAPDVMAICRAAMDA